MFRRCHVVVLVYPLALVLLSCGTKYWSEDADEEVYPLLERRTDAVLGRREAELLQPKIAEGEGRETRALEPSRESGRDEGPLALDLAKALSIAVEQNRDYLARKESLYLSGLSYTLTRFSFSPQLSGTLGYLLSDAEDAVGSHSANTSFSVSQILPTGGSLSLTTSLAGLVPEGGKATGSESFNGSVGVSFTQPLLRGGGYLVSHEALTQAQRNLVYAIRSFELFREDFSIDVASRFFDLVTQKTTLKNQQDRYDQAVFDRKKALALRSVERADDQAVFLAQRQENVAENALISATASYERAKDEFKILLGLPTSRAITIVDEKPPFDPVRLDWDSAVKAARVNRLDIRTQEEQLEDSARALRIAEDAFLPDLALTASYNLAGAGGSIPGALPDVWSYTAGLSLTIPLQRKSERNSYISTRISYVQTQRSFSETLDRLELDIRAQLRDLRSVEDRIELQKGQIKQEERAVAVTRIRYEAGEVDNRDLLDARQSLTDAKNELIRLQVQHFIGRLRLLRNLGLLFIDENGMWK